MRERLGGEVLHRLVVSLLLRFGHAFRLAGLGFGLLLGLLLGGRGAVSRFGAPAGRESGAHEGEAEGSGNRDCRMLLHFHSFPAHLRLFDAWNALCGYLIES